MGERVKRTKVPFCDECGKEPAVRYKVTSTIGNAQIDLCDKHAAPLRKIVGGIAAPARRGRGVHTIEEIEALKKQGLA